MKIQESRLLPLFTIVTLLFASSLIFPVQSFARSGCCSHHGGVCGCGCCDGTGLSTTCAPYYPECSQPVYVAPVVTVAPIIYTPVPTPKPTIKPVATAVPTPSPTTTASPTSSPEVQGASTQNTPTPILSPTPTPAPLTTGGTIGALAFLAVIIGLPIWIVVKIIKKFRKPKTEI